MGPSFHALDEVRAAGSAVREVVEG